MGTVDETVLLQQGGFGVLTVLHMDFNNNPFPVFGTGTYTGAGGSLSFDYEWTTATLLGGTQSLVGTWAMTGGTGTYAGLTGEGTLTTNHDLTNGYPSPSFTTFRGQLEAVPEPASMAALGLGAAAILKRRKRA
ncbi:PEP-CTERM sorting domain-containing protein [bacterium]|nr:MAG: PEP-CTERM sorting domain-containing protein [bacterium]